MARVFRRSWKNKDGRNTQSNVYYCRFQINGRDYVRSTEKTTERVALAKMKALMQEISDGAQVGHALEILIQAIAEIPEEHREEARREASAKPCLSGWLTTTLPVVVTTPPSECGDPTRHRTIPDKFRRISHPSMQS